MMWLLLLCVYISVQSILMRFAMMLEWPGLGKICYEFSSHLLRLLSVGSIIIVKIVRRQIFCPCLVCQKLVLGSYYEYVINFWLNGWKHPYVAHVATCLQRIHESQFSNVSVPLQDVVVQPELSSEFPLVCQSAQSSTVLTIPVRTFNSFFNRSW